MTDAITDPRNVRTSSFRLAYLQILRYMPKAQNKTTAPIEYTDINRIYGFRNLFGILE
jgi:hypothetical protein